MPDNLDYVAECFNNLSESYQVSYWNAYCDANNYPDSIIYDMEVVEAELSNKSAWELLTSHIVDPDSFCPYDTWAVSGFHGWKSSDNPSDLANMDADEEFLRYLYEVHGIGEEDD